MEKRLNLALFMGMIENNFSYAICEGVMMGAKAIDANLFILPGGLIGAQYDDVEANSYRYQYNTLYSFANFKSLDAILIEYGTITTFLGMKQQRNFLSQFKDVPIILLCGEQEGYSNIVVDNRAGIRSPMEHL